MRLLFVLLFFFNFLFAYKVSDRYLLHSFEGDRLDLHNHAAKFLIDSPFDFKMCTLQVDVRKVDKVHYNKNECRFKGALVCSEDGGYCVKKKRIPALILQKLNRYGVWYVNNVAPDDTLNMRKSPNTHAPIVYKIPYNASILKVVQFKNSGSSTWYRVKYQGHSGWINSRFLKIKNR